jgi:DNA-binding CsgD family transcriptional regulator
VIGDRDLCETAGRLLRDVPEPERRVFGPTGLAYLAYHEGRFAEAVARYEPIAELLPVGRGLLRWEVEWIESLVRVGRPEEARTLLHRLEEQLPPGVIGLTGLDRARGMLADDHDEAVAHFERAVRVGEETNNDFVIGRAETVWGERLRRMRRRAESRAHLERAVELLRAVGATRPAARAAAELQVAGGVVSEGAASHELLTPQELQIARLVVAGASNRDLAQRLFISPRTVEAHLTAIFRKLGVRNRRELAARALDDSSLQP